MAPASSDAKRGRGRRRSGGIGVGIEENILAILDDAEDTHYSHDDRLAFLEAVRTTAVVADNGTPPTSKMLEAIFQIFGRGKSLELIVASFRLLNELEQNFPRVYSDAGVASEPSSSSQAELVVDKEVWSPFSLKPDSSDRATSKESFSGRIDHSGFHVLIQELAGAVNDKDVQPADLKFLRNMLLFQYLVVVLEEEFLARRAIYKETMQWSVIRESTLNLLLGSRRVNYKALVKDCVYAVCGLNKLLATSDLISSGASAAKSSKDSRLSLVIASLEVEEGARMAMQKLMIMIMELDVMKKQADLQGFTTRADSVRTPLIEIIVDEITYNTEILSPVLQVLDHPRWKLELVLQYFAKYITRPAVRTRRASDSKEETTFRGTLRSFANISSVKSIMKKIGAEALQLLLAHGFQAHMAPSSEYSQSEGIPGSNIDGCLMEICEEMISAFNSLRKTDGRMEVLPMAREALFVASRILSMKS